MNISIKKLLNTPITTQLIYAHVIAYLILITLVVDELISEK